MPKINLLPRNVAELIAAGEVVERPASVIKELAENSIDARATSVTIEIKRGGITYMRVTDNGCGIAYEDVPTAFLRHATSKIKSGEDLEAISTLGFRGEALAAVSSVARVEMLTAEDNAEYGAHYVIEGGEEVLYEESGCPKGTTIVIRDLFYNTPARMKFLKKDVSEANACAAVVDRIALSHPEIAFKFIRDGKVVLATPGDGKLKSAVYTVLGRQFSSELIEACGENAGITVSGYVCRPVSCKPTRNGQYTFLNGRLVRSGTVVAAVEQAYKNSAMIGKFPSFVLRLEIPFNTVDVNVHPAKTEVRFSDEKRIFDAVYQTVKSAVSQNDTRPQIQFKVPAFNRFENMTAKEYRQQKLDEPLTAAEKIYGKPFGLHNQEKSFVSFKQQQTNLTFKKDDFAAPEKLSEDGCSGKKYNENTFDIASAEVSAENISVNEPSDSDIEKSCSGGTAETEVSDLEKAPDVTEEKETVTVIGEVFSTYIVAQMGNSVFLIDKHAAHERILFNKLKSERTTEIQALLTPVTVRLAKEEYNAVVNNCDILEHYGFEVEDFGNSAVVVRAVPAFLADEDIAGLISEAASGIMTAGGVTMQKEENLMHTVSCRAAIKAGNKITLTEMQSLAEKVLYSNEIMYCPHGRPVAFEIKKRDLEKQFGRIQ